MPRLLSQCSGIYTFAHFSEPRALRDDLLFILLVLGYFTSKRGSIENPHYPLQAKVLDKQPWPNQSRGVGKYSAFFTRHRTSSGKLIFTRTLRTVKRDWESHETIANTSLMYDFVHFNLYHIVRVGAMLWRKVMHEALCWVVWRLGSKQMVNGDSEVKRPADFAVGSIFGV
jgi:hypothetical protein